MNGQNRNINEIKHELDQTRAAMENTLNTIEQKFSSHYIADRFQEYVQEGVAADYVRNLSSSIAANPVPATLLGVSLAWLMYAHNGRAQAQYEVHEGPGLTSRMKEKASSASHKIGSSMQHARERTSDTVNQFRDKAGYQTKRLQDNYNWMLQEHPLALGMIGVAVGAVLGASIPETNAENTTLGRTRDRVMRKAGEAGSEMSQRAQRTVQAAAAAAQEEAKR